MLAHPYICALACCLHAGAGLQFARFVNVRDEHGAKPLHLAARQGRPPPAARRGNNNLDCMRPGAPRSPGALIASTGRAGTIAGYAVALKRMALLNPAAAAAEPGHGVAVPAQVHQRASSTRRPRAKALLVLEARGPHGMEANTAASAWS